MRILLLLFLSFNLYSLEITEENLLALASKDVPALDEIESRLLLSESNYKRELDDQTGSSAYAGYNHLNTKERAIIPFIPIYSPVNQYHAGIKKPTQYGVSADLYTTVDQRSGASSSQSFKDIHTTIYALRLNFDLWKDVFGKLTRKKIENARISYKSAKLQKEIELKSFKVAVRRLYWTLVANNEKIKLSQTLLEASQKQAKDAKKREQASIADPGEVARYQAQVAQRRGTLLYLKYEKEILLKKLTDLVPKLKGQDVSLGAYNLDQMLGEVLQCAALIEGQKSAPLDFTRYDEVSSLLQEIQFNQKKIDKTYNDVDLKLATTFKQTGLGSDEVNGDYIGSYDKSLEDMRDNDRSGFEAALTLTIPIGKKVNGTEDVIKEYNRKRLRANIENTNTNITSTHMQIAKSVILLRDVIKEQELNNQQLLIRVKEMRKQYGQARISVNALIQDEDSLASGALSLVDTQLSVLNTLFDYFAVFTETPCSFNRI